MGDVVGEFYGRYLLQHDHRLCTALPVRFVHVQSTVAVLSA